MSGKERLGQARVWSGLMFGARKTRLLIIKADSLAGFVAAEPVFQQIRHSFQDAEISLLTTPDLLRLAKAAPYFDQVAALPDFGNPEERKSFTTQLKAAKFTRVLDLSGPETSRKVASAFGPLGPKWFSVSQPSARSRKRTIDDLYPDTEKLCAANGVALPERLPDLSWALGARKDSANMQPSWFGISGPFGILAPGLDEKKRWPGEAYGQFARISSEAGVMPVLIGPRELHVFGDIVSEVAPTIVDLTGKTDHLQLVALAKEASFFVSDCADEVNLAVSVGAAGVLIKKQGEEALAPSGRNVMAVTVKRSLSEAAAPYVWQCLNNMGVVPREEGLLHANSY
ncbi:MAG: glycosyltransferase family 9 protein [Pseudomonadota bacterium]